MTCERREPIDKFVQCSIIKTYALLIPKLLQCNCYTKYLFFIRFIFNCLHMTYTVYTKSDIYCLKFYTRFRFLFPKHALSKNAHFLGQRDKMFQNGIFKFIIHIFATCFLFAQFDLSQKHRTVELFILKCRKYAYHC